MSNSYILNVFPKSPALCNIVEPRYLATNSSLLAKASLSIFHSDTLSKGMDLKFPFASKYGGINTLKYGLSLQLTKTIGAFQYLAAV